MKVDSTQSLLRREDIETGDSESSRAKLKWQDASGKEVPDNTAGAQPVAEKGQQVKWKDSTNKDVPAGTPNATAYAVAFLFEGMRPVRCCNSKEATGGFKNSLEQQMQEFKEENQQDMQAILKTQVATESDRLVLPSSGHGTF